MSRYIDADYFANEIEDIIKSQRYDELVTCEKKFPTVADVLATVVDELRGKSLNGFEHCPTVDVRENVRGEWLHKDGIYGVVFCSECDYELHINNTNFCPNCGADMRGVKE